VTHVVRWHLELGGEVIACIADARDYDFPWTCGTRVRSPAFVRFRPYFTCPDDWPDDDPVVDALCGEVQSRGGFGLGDLTTGQVSPGIRINQRGESAWFRVG
jgi:hypothetical protein